MKWRCIIGLLGMAAWLAGCSTPYSPAVVVRDSDGFPGLNRLIEEAGQRPLEVVIVHGMCTHDSDWAHETIDGIAKKIDSGYVRPDPGPSRPAAPKQIQVVTQTSQLAGATVRLTALVWSPLTSTLKEQLEYDNTGRYTDCTIAGDSDNKCKPRRSRFNGRFKDVLLNDCLADAMIYGGVSYESIRNEMAKTLERVLEASSNQTGTLVFVTESLGSKILYDALAHMLSHESGSKMRTVAARAVNQLGVVFMGANQLPMLDLARQNAMGLAGSSLQNDSLARLLQLRRDEPGPKSVQRLAVVAFTDPNDLLSYRLRRKQYASTDVGIANVLVSNRKTWFGLIEEPYGAHTGYLSNPDVGQLMSTGWE